MDLSLLRDNLPASSGLAQADRDLLTNFKAAALSITTLYKSSLTTSKRAYNAGYAACLADVLGFIQAGLSAAETPVNFHDHAGGGIGALGLMNIDFDGRGMTIGRVMDYLEARVEAVRAEEEDEEDERQRGGSNCRPTAGPTATHAPTQHRTQPHSNVRVAAPTPVLSSKQSTSRDETQAQSGLPPASSNTAQHTNPSAPTPLGPVPSSQSQPQMPLSPVQGTLARTRSKSRQQPGKAKDTHDAFPFTFAPPNSLHNNTPNRNPSPPGSIGTDHSPSAPIRDDFNSAFPLVLPADMNVSIGTKRRHAQAMAMANILPPGVSELSSGDSNAGPSASGRSSGSRRRARGASALARNGTSAMLPPPSVQEDMEVEEEPARKRVARR